MLCILIAREVANLFDMLKCIIVKNLGGSHDQNMISTY